MTASTTYAATEYVLLIGEDGEAISATTRIFMITERQLENLGLPNKWEAGENEDCYFRTPYTVTIYRYVYDVED